MDATKFVELREAWFNRVLKLDENRAEGRCYDPKAANAELKAHYDQQTVGIVLGKDHPVSPRCPADVSGRF